MYFITTNNHLEVKSRRTRVVGRVICSRLLVVDPARKRREQTGNS
jgi:hypothetical protein